MGDKLLVKVTERIKSCLRKTDNLARIGGDEFIILCDEIANKSDTKLISQKIIELVAKPLMIEGYVISISTSIGVATYKKDGSDYEELMLAADKALYKAKNSGKNQAYFFEKKQ